MVFQAECVNLDNPPVGGTPCADSGRATQEQCPVSKFTPTDRRTLAGINGKLETRCHLLGDALILGRPPWCLFSPASQVRRAAFGSQHAVAAGRGICLAPTFSGSPS